MATLVNAVSHVYIEYYQICSPCLNILVGICIQIFKALVRKKNNKQVLMVVRQGTE